MSIFSSEKEMQEWLSSHLEKEEGLTDLVINREEIAERKPRNYAEARVIDSINKVFSSLHSTVKISEDENISSVTGEILRPDFVLYSPDTQSLIIVELKNLVSPSRQAGTELAAYSAGIRKFTPLLAEGDMAHVLISSVWPTLLKHYARDQILWQGRNLLCLTPVQLDTSEIALAIVDPGEISGVDLEYRLTPEQVCGYQICLYNYQNKADLTQHENQLKAALQLMANEGNRQRSHGFAYLWRDHASFSLAPYSITCMVVAPFAFPDEILKEKQVADSSFFDKFQEVIQDFCPSGHGEALKEISNIGRDFVENICDPRYEGFYSWEMHRMEMQPRAEKIAFIGWGVFGEVFFSELQKKYQSGSAVIDLMDPEIGDYAVDALVETKAAIVSAFDEVANPQKGQERDGYYAGPPDNCDLCGKSLAREKYFIDGKLSGSHMWANMCGHCYRLRGEDIRWGRGQLFKNCGPGRWLMVGGFEDDEFVQ
ncbi:hypothetical protein H3H36_24510 [Duganella sp. FT3S]|uniref:Uncharacterized protein n=1 Tax=Rugamonas fusca TaxID=2758568 RepID=A0A7W2EMA8_9BURK|nr:hypothetical protein [Rugamonas fusca]MBA5608513.1 hypothetical protein [Rugamonas fusca]